MHRQLKSFPNVSLLKRIQIDNLFANSGLILSADCAIIPNMKNITGKLITLLAVAAILIGTALIVYSRAARISANKQAEEESLKIALSVDGRSMTVGELRLRAGAMLADAKKHGGLFYAESKHAEALRHFEHKVAEKTIVKFLLAAEARRRGLQASDSDRKKFEKIFAGKFKDRNMTLEEYFKSGILPEEKMREEFEDDVLAFKLGESVVSTGIRIEPVEVEKRLAELVKAAAKLKAMGKDVKKVTRTMAMDTLFSEKREIAFHAMVMNLRMKAKVECPLFPDLEKVEEFGPRKKLLKAASVKPAPLVPAVPVGAQSAVTNAVEKQPGK